VPRLGVTELPLAGGAGQLAGGTGSPQLALALAAGHLLRHVAQQRLAELPHRLRAQLEVAVRATAHRAAVAERALELLQGPRVDPGVVAELPGQRVEVEVVHAGATVGLRQLLGELVEVGQVLEDTGAVAEAEPFGAVHALGAVPVLARPQRLEVGVEPGQRLHQGRRAERLLGELHQLGALLGRHRVEHPLRGRGAGGHGVEELVEVLRVLGEEVPVLGHELVEVLLGVLTPAPLLEQLVEVAQHLVDRRAVLVGGVLECLLHAGEPLVQQLAAEQVLDLLVGLAGLAALPVVRRQLADGCGHVGRPPVRVCSLQLQLAECAVAVVHVDVARELLALLEHRLVEKLADLVEGAVEVVPLQQLAPPLGHPAGEVVEAALVATAPAQELPHRALGRVAGHHVLADRVQRLADVDRRGERVAAAVPPVARADLPGGVPVSHRSAPRVRRPVRRAGSRPRRRPGPAAS
jgi:hypothetical protein